MGNSNPSINLVVYLDADTIKLKNKKELAYAAAHGYSYDLTKEGKRKLVKDVATSSGYFAGNKQRPNTVVQVEEILTHLNPAVKTLTSALVGSFNMILAKLVVEHETYKNLCLISRFTELELLLKLTTKQLDKSNFKLGNLEVNDEDKKIIAKSIELIKQIKDLGNLIVFDATASAEGGLGNRLNAKELDTALVETKWGTNQAPMLSMVSRKEYESPVSDFNRMVSASRWYFESGDSEDFYKLKDGYRVYDFGKVEPDKKYYGKMTPDVTYSRLYTKTPVTHLDKMYNFADKKISNPNHYLLAGDLRTITSKDTCRLLDTLPGYVEKEDLISPISRQGKKPILIEVINPVMLSFRVRETLESIDDLYTFFRDRNDDNVFGNTKFYDITDELYLFEENKKGDKKVKLRPEFTQNTAVHYTNVEHRNANKKVRIMLSIGFDLPERNSLSSVTDTSVKVWVAVDTTNDVGLRYATVVETDDFLYIHSSFGSNLRVLSKKELKS